MSIVKGVAYKDEFTKRLIQKPVKDSIVVIKHKGIDLVAAQDLKYKRVRAIINCENTIDWIACIQGAEFLINNNIKVFDVYDKNFFDKVNNGDCVCIKNNMVYINNKLCSYCHQISKQDLLMNDQDMIVSNKENKCRFIKNTMEFMNNELDYFINYKDLQYISTDIKGREVIIVSRGRSYREDLKYVKQFIKNRRPILIGVDGGADAITDVGFKSDIIIGDMDSVSNNSLLNCNEVLVHTYSDGYAPGLHRIESLGLVYKKLMLKGTSEDAAIYMSVLKGASTIYLVGSHLNMDEFIEKNRRGMGSTLLLRILYGTKIIDLKGFSNIVISNNTNLVKVSLLSFLFILILFTAGFNNVIADYLKTNINILLNIK